MMDYSLLLNQNEKKSSTHKKAAFELGLQYVVLPLVRTLAAADNAVMLVDAGKGLEPQTRKLFEVSNEIAILLPRVLEFLRAPFWAQGLSSLSLR